MKDLIRWDSNLVELSINSNDQMTVIAPSCLFKSSPL